MKKPNILLLFADQQRHDTINAAGFKHMKTPNLDKLVNEGCLFKNAYSPTRFANLHGIIFLQEQDQDIMDIILITVNQ